MQGYGDNKPRSSTTPQEVKTLQGAYIQSVSCGYGTTLLLARNDSEDDKKSLKKIPEFKPWRIRSISVVVVQFFSYCFHTINHNFKLKVFKYEFKTIWYKMFKVLIKNVNTYLINILFSIKSYFDLIAIPVLGYKIWHYTYTAYHHVIIVHMVRTISSKYPLNPLNLIC